MYILNLVKVGKESILIFIKLVPVFKCDHTKYYFYIQGDLHYFFPLI